MPSNIHISGFHANTGVLDILGSISDGCMIGSMITYQMGERVMARGSVSEWGFELLVEV